MSPGANFHSNIKAIIISSEIMWHGKKLMNFHIFYFNQRLDPGPWGSKAWPESWLKSPDPHSSAQN